MVEEAAYDELSEKYERLIAAHSVALDEIWRLRAAMAYEHGVSKVHGGYATFPKSRRAALDQQLERMQASAKGDVEQAYWAHAARLSWYLRDVGASTTLTRSEYEEARADAIACYPRPVGKDGENFNHDRTSTDSGAGSGLRDR